jgi:hypothetical protein
VERTGAHGGFMAAHTLKGCYTNGYCTAMSVRSPLQAHADANACPGSPHATDEPGTKTTPRVAVGAQMTAAHVAPN